MWRGPNHAKRHVSQKLTNLVQIEYCMKLVFGSIMLRSVIHFLISSSVNWTCALDAPVLVHSHKLLLHCHTLLVQ